ncbi:MAG: LptF/LptG family permease [Elusimicrobia bacterium]|nr:LptF/LptG family permease [Elusimicrobiota bacterium]
MINRHRFLYDRHLMKELVFQFTLWCGFFTILFVLSVFLEKLDVFMNHKATIGAIGAYFGWQLPFWIWKAAPLAFLGSSLTVLDDAHRTGELTALEGLGIRPARIYLPLIAAALLLNLAGLCGVESRAPVFYRQAKDYLKTVIQKKNKPSGPLENFVAKGREGRYFAFASFDPKDESFRDFWLDEWDGQRHVREVFAKRGRFDGKRLLWMLEEVAEHAYAPGQIDDTQPGAVTTNITSRRILQLDETPGDLLPWAWSPDMMTVPELTENLKIMQQRGLAHRNLLTEYHARWAWPSSFLIMVILAITVLNVLPRKIFKGKLVLFGITIVLGLAYWFVLNLSKTLAGHGLIHPLLAAWGPHLVFIAAAQATRSPKLLGK